ncbi:MAG: hypothetical protein ACJAZK_000876 [Psychroserpens sp.]|jgi:uncharacterized protein YjaZ|uniref:DUF2268 domain-containing putative Zn-dependent protease n=1 Tax=Psychroserpens sp. TaxID=2020870 RepID=UPI0039E35A62
MNKSNKIILLTFTLLSSLVSSYGQTTSDKIIFLTDYYETFVEELNADDKKVDSIYNEKVLTPIYNRYFKKSEYSAIVKDFIASPINNIFELKQSIDRISKNKTTIENKIIGAINKSRLSIFNESLTIYVLPVNPNLKQVIAEMSGIMGLTAGSKQIILTIEPDILGWENMLEYAVAHEFNHAYWTNLNFGKSTNWTLLDYLVFEGKGDCFAHSMYPSVIAPWTTALTEKQISDLWNTIQPNLQSTDIGLQMEIMFGSNNYPVWGGYSVGYDIVRTALENNKSLKVEYWTNLEAVNILRKSKYK